jgi:Zn-dependent M28 family amino/carboxypeptidase
MTLPSAVVGDAYTSDFAWEALERIVDIENRMAGQEGEAEGAELTAELLREAGARDVGIDEFDIPGWWRGSAALTVDRDGERTYDLSHQVVGLPGSTDGTVEAALVDVGYGTEDEFADADVDGQIAMVTSDTPPDARWRHRMEKYASAVENGAVGFVFRNHVEGCLPPTGEVGYHDRPGNIPAVGVSKELGARLARYCADGPVPTELALECRNAPATSRNVEGVVGPDTDEAVLVTAHVDSHDIAEGAVDNGVGTALVAEVGRLLAAVEDDLETAVRLVVFGAEEIGLQGAYHWAATHDLDAVKCVLNIDGAGRSGPLRIRSGGFDDVTDAFERATDDLELRMGVDDTVSPHGDQWAFVEHGVPGVMVSTDAGDGSGRGWGHTHADTLDKVDPHDLRDLAAAVTGAALDLAAPDRTVADRTPAEIRDALSEGDDLELHVGNRWYFDDMDA